MAKRHHFVRIIFCIFILAGIVIIRRYGRFPWGQGPHHIVFPWIEILVVISLYLFYEYYRMAKAKRDNRRAYMKQQSQELLDNLRKQNNQPLPEDN